MALDEPPRPSGGRDRALTADCPAGGTCRQVRGRLRPDDPACRPARAADTPAGYFKLARLHGRVAGCGALKLVGDGIGEVKRMWTADFARGQGVARNVLETIEAKARALGIHTLRLETNKALLEAHALYRSAGYREVPAFNEEPYAHHWFAKQL